MATSSGTFVVLLYDRTSSLEHVNEARKELFTKKSRTIDRLPPTQAALIQHIKRAAYQAGHCWAQVMIAAPELPSPGDWGWKRKDQGCGWEAFWTALPEATQACRELIRCGCKKECRGRCMNAKKQHSNALLFVTVEDTVITNYSFTFITMYYEALLVNKNIKTPFI